MEKLHENIRSCNRCDLCKYIGGTTPVTGNGNPKAKIIIVGEAPGENEQLSSVPFVGLAGKLLDKLLESAKLNRNDIYITNIVKCRPTKNNKERSNRPPSMKEIRLCTPWLLQEIELINPQIIVTLGKIATYSLLNQYIKKTFTMGDIVNKPFILDTYTIIPNWHPSYLLQHGKSKRNEALQTFIGINNEL